MAKLHERRLHARLRDPELSASVAFRSGSTVTCAVEDLSLGGARLVASHTPAVGERVQLVLGEPGSASAISMLGRVVRAEAFRGSKWATVAVQFDELAEPARAAITALVRQHLARDARRATVLVVDDDPEARASLERDLGQLGFAARLATTPLDAIAALSATKIHVALVDLGGGGADVLRLLAAEHRNLRRVVMGEQGAAEVSAGRAHDVLVKPWTRATLELAVSGVAASRAR